MQEKKNLPRKTRKKPEVPPELQIEDPLAIYAKPDSVRPKDLNQSLSFMERFRWFAFYSKASIFLILLIAIVGFWVISLRTSKPASVTGVLRNYFSRFISRDLSARYQIGATSIPDSQILAAFAILRSVNPGIERDALSTFQRSQFENDLLIHDALAKGQLESSEAKLFMETALRQAAADYIILMNLTSAERSYNINIEESEVQSIYKQNSNKYAKAGVEKEVALQSIRSALVNDRLQKWNTMIIIKRAQLTRTIQESMGASYREVN